MQSTYLEGFINADLETITRAARSLKKEGKANFGIQFIVSKDKQIEDIFEWQYGQGGKFGFLSNGQMRGCVREYLAPYLSKPTYQIQLCGLTCE